MAYNKNDYIIGVDFGTSFSQVAVKQNGIVSRLCEAGLYGVPSLFFYKAGDGEFVGKAAKDRGSYDAENLVKEVKMSLNKKYVLDTKEYTAKEIISKIYGSLISKAKERGPVQIIDFNLAGIVITHPAEFKMPEVNLLKDAAANCLDALEPLNIVGTIKEPVAAALTYFDKAKDQLQNGDGVLVFDLGGGTTDVALVVKDDSAFAEFEVVDVGMERIGGRDFDQCLFDYFADKIEEMTNGERIIRGNVGYENEIYEEANKVKHDLTNLESAFFRPRLTFHSAISGGVKITRTAFEELSKGLLDSVMAVAQRVYDNNKDKINIKHVICVGGSSNMPMVERAMTEQFPNCQIKVYEPEYAVVTGAAIYADKIKEKPEEVEEKIDILPYSYGVRCVSGGKQCIRNILTRGSQFPARGKCADFKSSNEASVVNIDVYESKETEAIYEFDPSKATYVGRIELKSTSLISTTEKIDCELIMDDLSTISINATHNNQDKTTATFIIKSVE